MRLAFVFALAFVVSGIPSGSASGSAIKVTGDAELLALAGARGWAGAGTVDDPIVIGPCTIATAQNAAIHLKGTTLHVLIRDCDLSGRHHAVFAEEAHDVTLLRVVARSDVEGRDADRFRVIGSTLSARLLGNGAGHHYAETSSGALSVFSPGALIEDLHVTSSAWMAASVAGEGLVLRDSVIDAQGMVGLGMAGVQGVTVERNVIRGAEATAIMVWEDSTGNVIRGNDVTTRATGEVANWAISVFGSPEWGSIPSGNLIEGNTVRDGRGVGIRLADTHGNTIRSNFIVRNAQVGLWVENAEGNLIYDNWFENPFNVRVVHTVSHVGELAQRPVSAPRNTWSIEPTPGANIVGGAVLGGNFWSDHAGVDADGDTLGEAPYTLAGTQRAADFAPRLARADVGPFNEARALEPFDAHPLIPARIALAPT